MGGRVSSRADDETDQPTNEFFRAMFDVKEVIGRGSFGAVHRCVYKHGMNRLRRNNSYAVKFISKNSRWNKSRQAYSEATRFGRLLRHINITRFHAEIIEINLHYMVFEFVRGGSLFGDICNRVDYYEIDAKEYIRQLLDAVQFCHSYDIVHRKLEPSNILLDKPTNMIKLIDFSSARRTFLIEKSLKGKCGLAMYMAPEMVKGKPYGQSVDLWSCGVIIYNLLTGRHPFPPPYTKKMFKHILNSDNLEFSSDDIEGVSTHAIDLIECLMTHQEDIRVSAKAAFGHQYLREGAAASRITQQTLHNLRTLHDEVWGDFGSPVDESSYYGNYDGDHHMMKGESTTVVQVGELIRCEIDDESEEKED